MYFMADSIVKTKKMPYCVKPVVCPAHQCLQWCKGEASQEESEIGQFLLSLCIGHNWQEFHSRETARRPRCV